MAHCGSTYIGGRQVSLVCNKKNTGYVVLIFEEVWEGCYIYFVLRDFKFIAKCETLWD